MNAFKSCISLDNVVIDGNVDSIGDYAYSGCSSLKNISIGEGVSKIGKYAFQKCDSLQTITIPSTVETVEKYLFSGCTELNNLILKEGTKTLSEYFISGCSKLLEVTIPDSIATIKSYAFYNSGIKKINSSTFENLQSNWKLDVPSDIFVSLSSSYVVKSQVVDNIGFSYSGLTQSRSSFMSSEKAFWDWKLLNLNVSTYTSLINERKVDIYERIASMLTEKCTLGIYYVYSYSYGGSTAWEKIGTVSFNFYATDWIRK